MCYSTMLLPPSEHFIPRVRSIIIIILVLGMNVFLATSAPLSFILKVKKPVPSPKILLSSFGASVRIESAFTVPDRLRKNSTLTLTSQSKLTELEQYYVLTVSQDDHATSTIDEIRRNNAVESIEPMRVYHLDTPVSYPNDSLFEKQWAMKKIGAEKAWNTATGKGILVGVIDTGIDFFHPDLQKNLWVNAPEDLNKNGTLEPYFFTETKNGITGDLNGIDDDGNGYTDDVIGYDFVDQSIVNIGDASLRDAVPFDEQGHGTNVSGIIGATANNILGVAGIAHDCRLVSLRAFDATGNAEEDDIAAAIVYAALNGVRVLNMSFGDVVYSPITRAACQFAESMGVTLVASAGNDGATMRRFPASYAEVIAVAPTHDRGSRAAFSSYGSQLALSAPGVGIRTTPVGGKH